MMLYDIVRFYRAQGKRPRVLGRGLSKAQALAHCNDPATRKEGEWFDGFSKSGNY